MSHAETTRLFEAARAGTPEAADAFFRRSAAKLLPLIRLRMGPLLRAEMESRDVLQAVLLKACQKLPEVEDADAVMAWMARVAENEIRDRVDFHRRAARDAVQRRPLEDAADVPAPVRQALSLAILDEETARLEAALEALPPDQREAIVLRKLEELSFPEMAARLGRTPDACRMLFARAMAALTLRLAGGDGV